MNKKFTLMSLLYIFLFFTPNVSFSERLLKSSQSVSEFFKGKPLTSKEAYKYLSQTNKTFLDYFYLGKFFSENSKEKLAVRYFSKSIKKNDNYFTTYLYRAYSYYLLEKYTLSMRDLDRIIKSEKSDYLVGMAYYYKGIIQSENPYKFGGCSKARESFYNAQRYEPIVPEALYRRAACNSSNYKVAIEDINKAIKLSTNQGNKLNYYLLKGDILYNNGLFNKALSNYIIVLKSLKKNNFWHQKISKKIEDTRLMINAQLKAQKIKKRLFDKVKSYCLPVGGGMVCFEK